eukprot:g5973.t1
MFDASAIEQVMLLAKNAKGPASVVDLISGALSRPDLFVFGELLDLEIIQQLKDDIEVQPWYAALELFAYGIWNDYINHMESFPEFSESQKRKLKQLTAVTTVQGQKVSNFDQSRMLMSGKQITSYSTLKTDLGFEDARDLEDFLISHCFYSDIIQGKIDQEKELVVVADSIKRDVRVQDFSEIKSRLESWVSASEKCLEDVLNRIVFTRDAVEKAQVKKEQLFADAEKRMQEAKDSDGMMIDEQFALVGRPGLGINDEIREFKTRRANRYL